MYIGHRTSYLHPRVHMVHCPMKASYDVLLMVFKFSYLRNYGLYIGNRPNLTLCLHAV